MNLFGRRARIVELPSGSGALATGLYVGSAAGLASGGWSDDGSAAADASDQPVSADHDDSGQLAHDATVDSGSQAASEAASQSASEPAIDTSGSANDGSGGGNWWDAGGDFSGGWSVGDISGG